MNLLNIHAPSFSCFIVIAATLVLAKTCHAQNSPNDYVNAHNRARAAVGVGNIQWDEQLAAYAQQYANQRSKDCALRQSIGPYGENIAAGSGDFMTGAAAVRMWVDEKVYYQYDSNTCDPGKICVHYTQVVWQNSVHVGCARVQCDNGWFFVTCNYDPPGNLIGERPFLNSDQTY